MGIGTAGYEEAAETPRDDERPDLGRALRALPSKESHLGLGCLFATLLEEEYSIGGRRTQNNKWFAAARNDELFATRIGASAALGQELNNT